MVITDKLDGWNYIETQVDIDELQKITGGFHDAFIQTCEYDCGCCIESKTREEKKISCKIHHDYGNKLQMVFDNIWFEKPFEMVFEHVSILLLQPSDNLPTIYGAQIVLKEDVSFIIFNHSVHFNELLEKSEIKLKDLNEYDNIFVKAKTLRWRWLT